MRNQILRGDALSVLKTLPDNYVQTVVTSPPYYGLRSYLPDGHPDKALEIGLEETPEVYITRLVEVFREVRRVLRPDGTLWINIGDSYAGSGKGAGGKQEYHQEHIPSGGYVNNLKPKDLIGIPWMLAFALRTDGWYLRADCIWNKPNGKCESVEDRPTKTHEYLFLLSKSRRYYYDGDAIAEPASYQETRNGRIGAYQDRAIFAIGDGTTPTAVAQRDLTTRNKRSVWSINTFPYPEAHFAVMPAKLVEPCILAGTSPRACEYCGTPWKRVIVPTGHINKRETAHAPHSSPTKVDSTGWEPTKIATNRWESTCMCSNDGLGQCIVLDPFMGTGTVALVAIQHGRDYIGIELNADYIILIEKRIAQVQQHLWTGISDMEVPA